MGRPVKKANFGSTGTAGAQIQLTADLGSGNVSAYIVKQKTATLFVASDGSATANVKLQAATPTAPGQARCLVKAFGGHSATITMTIATPGVVTWASHGHAIGDVVVFTTTGALPTGVTAGTPYYIISAGFGAGAFQFSATPGGAAVNTTGTQSGVHTATSTTNDYARIILQHDVKTFGGRTYKWVTSETINPTEAKIQNA